MAGPPHPDTAPFRPHIRTTGLHLWSLPSTACSSTQTRPLPVVPPSDWLRLFLSLTFTRINTPTISSRLFFLLTPPMKKEQTECSETSAYKIQMPGNHPKEGIQQSKQCETGGRHRTLSRIIPGSILDFSNTCCLADIWHLLRILLRLWLGFWISSILIKLNFIVVGNSAFYVSFENCKNRMLYVETSTACSSVRR